jgi:hypothetical protein
MNLHVRRSNWDTLPAELWRIVFGYGSLKEFVAVSLVSKRLQQLVKPFLYAKFSWIPENDDSLPRVSDLGGATISECTKSRRKCWTRGLVPYGPPPYRLLQTLIVRPDLCRYIKEVELLMVSPETGVFQNRYEAREAGFSRETLDMCETYYFTNRNVPHRPHPGYFWLTYYMNVGRLEAYMAYLLVILRKMRILNLRLLGPVENHLMLNALLNHPEPFSIKVLKFTANPIRPPTRNNERAPRPHHVVRALRSILSLSAKSMTEILCIEELEEVLDAESPSLIGIPNSIKTLSLPDSDIDWHCIGILLGAMPHLEHFDFFLGYDPKLAEEVCEGDLVNQVLSRVQSTLISLSIKVDIFDPWPDSVWQPEKPLGSLTHFKKLK